MGKGARSRARRQASMAARRETVQLKRAGELWPGLADGIPSRAGARIRLARPDDDAALRHYIIQATEDEGTNDTTKPVPIACPTILAGLRDGKEGFQTAFKDAWVSLDPETADDQILVGFSLVAVDENDTVIGSISVCPPYNFLNTIIDDFSSREAHMILLQTQMGISKITAVAVREDLRGQGIGADLVQTALQVIRRCNIGMIVLGSCEPDRAVFYRRLGFTISPVDEPIDLYRAIGVHAMLETPDHHIFSMRRQVRYR
ncbi:Acetyltransferase (GNAT) family protein [Nocardioides sp. YR527]|uniref:GNAT family N-acetyltransferase n=1 Tax=Nocardioides sp. YR527 TaxID=1881028 RepID=UPI00088BB10A|nr:GNAT family N-acetyltransferase [Nocardioides sp. YR527]SDL33606.1 Acetyltransferase (GNAT) family protein [Nocardioides sp. YR527]